MNSYKIKNNNRIKNKNRIKNNNKFIIIYRIIKIKINNNKLV
jgi:hypothetical protein